VGRVMKRILRGLLPVAFALTSVARADSLSDQLPKNVLSYERPSYPLELKAASVTDGYATLAFVVRSDGGIDDAVVLEASHPAFGESVLEVLPMWRFESAAAGALPRREVLRFEFKQTDGVVSLSHRDAAKAAFPLEERTPIRTVSWTNLATPPERLSTLPPTVKATGTGNVAVSYIIDTQGKVRVPAVVNATRPDLGMAALAAVKQWQFSPPMHDGLPVLVEDTRSFTFGKK